MDSSQRKANFINDNVVNADQEIFVRGAGSRSVCQKKAPTFFFCFVFFSPQLILQKSNGQFQRNLSFFKVPKGVQHFPGGSNCLFPIETHITCDFPGGGSGPLSPPPPSGSALVVNQLRVDVNMDSCSSS